MIFKSKTFTFTEIDGKSFITKGVGKMFYQEGYPIGILAREAEKRGYVVSWLHVADELQKHGWANKTILSRLREELADTGSSLDFSLIEKFLESSYEDQRDMIFQYLYGSREKGEEWLRNLLKTENNTGS